MDERVMRFRVGAVVVAGAAVTVVMTLFFGAWQKLKPHYQIRIVFPEAPGVKVDTPVRKSGVLIGRVSEVKLWEEGSKEEDKGSILVVAAVDQEFKLRQRETCRIAQSSLFGDSVLEFVPCTEKELAARFDKAKGFDPNALIGDGDLLSGEVTSTPARLMANLEHNVQEALDSVAKAGNEVRKMAGNVNQTLGDNKQEIPELMAKTKQTIETLNTTLKTVNAILGDEEFVGSLRKSLREVPELLIKTRGTLDKVDGAITEFRGATQKVQESLEHLQPFTDAIGEDGPRIIKKVAASSDELDQFLKILVGFANQLKSGDGTLGKLVRDDEVYQRLLSTMANAEEITRRLRPILDDVRVFTDKIARDPRQLGVQGALDRRPTGLKTAVPY